ncbi:hypothetical protein [Ornithinibacillus scapharcae]|uniref:hypothetical protein n=1 Tax=Ornithinibacillus scapharcae TaxID=1147159 RepID=UPI000225BA54|nr:hypothetical protein [Ornithinibacillus scapharcae]
MSKLTKKDFDDYLGIESYHTKEDHERFYRNIQTSKGRNFYWLPKSLTAALIIGLFVVGTQFLLGNIPFISSDDNESDSEEKTDWSLWKEADSLHDVDYFYDAIIPGLKIARERNQVIDINQKHSLNDEVRLYIDKAWFHEDKIYLFYSMDLLTDDFVEKNHQTGSIDDFVLLEKDGTNIKLKTDSPSPWSGIVFHDSFNNKLYRVATITLEDEKLLAEADQLTASFSIDAHHEEVSLSNIELPVAYGDETITSRALNESFQTLHSYISFKRFDKSADTGYLFGVVDSDLGQEVETLHGTITLDNGEEIYLTDRLTVLYDGEFILDLPELAHENVSIDIDYLSMLEKEKTIDIPIDLSDYHKEGSENVIEQSKTINEPIAELGNTNILLRSIHFDNQGVTVTISTNKIATDLPTQINFYSFFPESAGWGFPNSLNAVDNNGEEAEDYHFHSMSDSGESNEFTFGLTRKFIENKEHVTISISNLSIGEEFEWNAEISKQD